MFIIRMNPDDNPYGYLGAICIMNESPYYITGETGPTSFPTEKDAEKTIKDLKKLRPKVVFEVMPIDAYLVIVSPMWDDQCKWLKPMREKYIEQ